MKSLAVVLGAIVSLALLGACDREEQRHEVHLGKGVYAGKPMTKLDENQVNELQRRARDGAY